MKENIFAFPRLKKLTESCNIYFLMLSDGGSIFNLPGRDKVIQTKWAPATKVYKPTGVSSRYKSRNFTENSEYNL